MEKLVNEVSVNLRVVEHKGAPLVCPTSLAELKLILKSRLPQVEATCQLITVSSYVQNS